MELDIQTRVLPRLPFFQDTIISDNIFGLNIWFSFTFNIFSGPRWLQHINYSDSDSDSDFWEQWQQYKSIKHVGTSWTLLCKRQLRYLGRNNLEGKYFHISNCILTMKGCADKKLFWDVFLRLTSCVFMKNFRFISPALQVFCKKMPYF